MTLKDDGSFAQGFWIGGQKLNFAINGKFKDISAGEHGKNLFSSTYMDP